MISIGCKLNGISGEITPAVIRQINKRYYTPGQANIADSLILQGYTMLTWGEGQQSLDNENEEDVTDSGQ